MPILSMFGNILLQTVS